ncbi:MAG: transcriptional repressor [Dehalococcoidia bacterium]|nr:transcriptional repressor [Dehalococcoidia bacterium]
MRQSLIRLNAKLGDQLLQRLSDAGARATRARGAVLRSLASRSGGFTIEELCRDVRPVGRATVYRTVRLLLREGLVCKLAMGDATPRYALSRPGHHHHAVCVRCGTIEDFRGCDLDKLVRKLAAAAQSDLLGHRLEVYVVCAACRASTVGQRGTRPAPTAGAARRAQPA